MSPFVLPGTSLHLECLLRRWLVDELESTSPLGIPEFLGCRPHVTVPILATQDTSEQIRQKQQRLIFLALPLELPYVDAAITANSTELANKSIPLELVELPGINNEVDKRWYYLIAGRVDFEAGKDRLGQEAQIVEIVWFYLWVQALALIGGLCISRNSSTIVGEFGLPACKRYILCCPRVNKDNSNLSL